jgi:hypothetical protein
MNRFNPIRCPECGWHTERPKVRQFRKWIGCVHYEIQQLFCEKLFCSGRVESKVEKATNHDFRRYVARNSQNAVIRSETRCVKCGDEY